MKESTLLTIIVILDSLTTVIANSKVFLGMLG